MRAEWKLNVFMQRVELRNKSDKKPEWKWNKAHDKTVRENKNEIDWYRYQKHILLSLLLSFAK